MSPFKLSAWRRVIAACLLLCMALADLGVVAQTQQKVVDIPTRPGVTQRFIYIASPATKGSVILMAGSNGGLQIADDGDMKRGKGNFLVRTRQQFADAGFAVAVVDTPSDRQSSPFLGGFRQTAEHASDIKAVIAWLKQQSPGPVWLVGTSRGTQSAGYVASEMAPAQGGPDGLVLSSTILFDPAGHAVPKMPLARISIPVLVLHHEQDGCRLCAFSYMPQLMSQLAKNPKAELISFRGGQNEGDPCEPMAYHGYNGIDKEVVGRATDWMLEARP